MKPRDLRCTAVTRALACILCLALAASPAAARQAPDEAPAIFADDAAIERARLSPDGRRLALIAQGADGAPVVAVVPVERAGRMSDLRQAARPISLPQGGPQPAREVRWSADGRRVLIIAGGADETAQALYAAPAPSGDQAPGEALALTPPDAQARLLALSARRPDEALVAIGRPRETHEAPVWSAWIVDLTTGRRRLAMPGGGATGFIADADLAVRLLRAPTPSGGARLELSAGLPVGEGAALVEWTRQEAARSRALGFDASGRILHAIDARGGRAQLVAIDAQTGETAPLVATGSEVTGALRTSDGVCLGAWTSDPAAPFIAIDRSVEADMRAIRAFASGEIRVVSQSGGVWLIAYERDGAPTRWALHERSGRTIRSLFSASP